MTGQHPATATPCCQPASPAVVEPPYAAGGAPQPTPAAAVCSLPAAYDSRLLSSFPRLATGLNGLYATSASTAYAAADPQGYVTAAALAAGSNPSFYSSLPNPYDLKESRGAWAPLSQGTAAACYSYDPTGLAAYSPYGDRYSSMDSVARRKNATRETTNTLKAWLYEHRKNPYPTKGEKIMLAIITKMTLTQVSTWFANARRRLKKENKMTWEPRNKSADSADADDKEEEDDDDNNSSSPSPAICDVRKKSQDDSCADDDDSQELRVKTELTNSLPAERIKASEFSSCSVKSESTELTGSSDCLALNLGPYADHHTSIIACSPESDYHRRPGSPLSPPCSGPPPPLHHRHYDDRSHHPPHHSHPPNVPRRPFHHTSHQHHGAHHQETSPTGVLCDGDPMLVDDRPKIWSLAHTATSDSPPTALKRLSGTPPPPPPLSQPLIPPSRITDDPYAIDCGSPKATPPPNTAHPTVPGSYSCGGGLPSHAPSEGGDVQRRWLNGGGSGDCARTVSNCDGGDKRNRYVGGGMLDNYVGSDLRRYSGNNGGSDGNAPTNYSSCGAPLSTADCFSPPRNPTLFESCLSPSAASATVRTQTYKSETSIINTTSSQSSYLAGGDVNSSSSSSSPSAVGHRPAPNPTSVTAAPSCDYALRRQTHVSVHHHRKPPPYGNSDSDTNNLPPRSSIGEYGLDNSSTSGQGKPIRHEKDELLSPENLGMTTTSCLNIIR